MYSIHDYPTDEHVSNLVASMGHVLMLGGRKILCWTDEKTVAKLVIDFSEGRINRTHAHGLSAVIDRMHTMARNKRLEKLYLSQHQA